ncbi:MAG: enolase C-terminal domain-like protein [Armatimonas sp.]
MLISDFRIHSLAFADPPLFAASGLHAPLALRTVIELEGADGTIGLAETHGGSVPAEALEAVRADVIGQDARSVALKLVGKAQNMALSAIDVAALDLMGKVTGQPVWALLGGKLRERIPFSAYAFYKLEDDWSGFSRAMDPAGMLAQVQKLIADYGFGSVKLKAGVLDPEIEIESLKLLRRTLGPDVPLRIDPNAAWSVETSLSAGRELVEELSNGGYFEDPTRGMAGMAEVRKRLLSEGIDTPLATNMVVVSYPTLAESVPLDAVQVVLGDHHYWGGLRATVELGRVCQTFGLGLSMHSNSHLGISLMAMVHAAAATSHLSYACDTHYPWQRAEDEICAEGRIPITDGCVTVPDAPGLGVTLNPDVLARLKENYARCGMTRRDDAAEMRKHIDPNWQYVCPRW